MYSFTRILSSVIALFAFVVPATFLFAQENVDDATPKITDTSKASTSAPFVYEAPDFFSPTMTQEEFEALTPEQQANIGTYLSRNALVAPGVVMEISSVEAILDSATYDAGDTATVTLPWTSPIVTDTLMHDEAEGLPALSFAVTLLNHNGKACTDTYVSSVVTSNTTPSISLPITSGCVRPQVSVSITDWNGTLLGTWNINPETPNNVFGWVAAISAMLVLFVVGILLKKTDLGVLFKSKK